MKNVDDDVAAASLSNDESKKRSTIDMEKAAAVASCSETVATAQDTAAAGPAWSCVCSGKFNVRKVRVKIKEKL